MQSLLMQRKACGLHAADKSAAMQLLRHAIWGNVYGEMEPEQLITKLTFPEDVARMCRDDIISMLVFFFKLRFNWYIS